jgi:uncharacterized protein
MAEFTSHAPGTFCWPELSTSDQKGAVAFYRGLFGWDVKDEPMGPTEVYSLFRMRGLDVAAAYTRRAEEKDVPPHWGSYIAVASADDAVKKAAALGAKVFAPPFDVMDAGRTAVLQDPTGAVFHVWQAKRSAGARILGEDGALCWTELSTRDTKTAETFYTQLFGWTPKHSKPGTMEYTEFSNNGQQGIGMMPMPPMIPAEVPPFWLPYFQVADAGASAARAKALGGNMLLPPTDIPNVGRFAVVADPQGASFAIYKPSRA